MPTGCIAPSVLEISVGFVQCRELRQEVCALLSGMVGRLLGPPPAADLAPLGTLLPAMLSTLGEAVEAEYAAGRPMAAGAAKCIVQLVTALTSDAPPLLQPFLHEVRSASCPKTREKPLALPGSAAFPVRREGVCLPVVSAGGPPP
jgi:hypothetical protein